MEKHTHISQVPEELRYGHYSEDLFDGTDRKPSEASPDENEAASLQATLGFVRQYPELATSEEIQVYIRSRAEADIDK
jgi:hypothetical protein